LLNPAKQPLTIFYGDNLSNGWTLGILYSVGFSHYIWVNRQGTVIIGVTKNCWRVFLQ